VRRTVVGLGAWLLAAEVATAQSPTPSPSPVVTAASAVPVSSPAPAASPRADTPRRKLRLEPYIDPYGKVPLPGIDMPRFDQRVDVPGKAMDPISLTARMNWFLGKDWQPMRGAVPRGSSAPMLEETYPFRPRPAPAVDVLPIIQWLTDRLQKN
jgi:hypothetical protein